MPCPDHDAAQHRRTSPGTSPGMSPASSRGTAPCTAACTGLNPNPGPSPNAMPGPYLIAPPTFITSAVILAAGESRRMGCPKPLLPWGDVPLVRHVAQVFADGGASEIVVVVGCNADLVAAAVLGAQALRTTAPTAPTSPTPLLVVENPDWPLGMSSSAAAGARACRPDADAIMICPADLPMLRPSNIAALIGGFAALRRAHPRCKAAVASHLGVRGHPAIVSAELRPDLEHLGHGPLTLRHLVDSGMRLAGGLGLIEAGPECIAPDIDFPEDYERAKPRKDSV